MAISYFAYCRLSRSETQRRIDFLRRSRPDWFGGMVALMDAERLRHISGEMAAEFGVMSGAHFALHVLNHDWLAEIREALEYAYEVFGTDDLVITFESETPIVPRARYPGRAFD